MDCSLLGSSHGHTEKHSQGYGGSGFCGPMFRPLHSADRVSSVGMAAHLSADGWGRFGQMVSHGLPERRTSNDESSRARRHGCRWRCEPITALGYRVVECTQAPCWSSQRPAFQLDASGRPGNSATLLLGSGVFENSLHAALSPSRWPLPRCASSHDLTWRSSCSRSMGHRDERGEI